MATGSRMLQAWFGVGLGNTTECAICMAPFTETDPNFVDEHPTWHNYAKPEWLFVTQCCQNFFHRDCIDYMKSIGQRRCPVCRTPNVAEFNPERAMPHDRAHAAGYRERIRALRNHLEAGIWTTPRDEQNLESFRRRAAENRALIERMHRE